MDREEIFSYAAALDQSGRMRNTILCNERDVLVINSDRTILLRFALPETSAAFKETVIFDANDYDSANFYVEGDSIVFKTVQDGYVRKKKCGSSKSLSFDEIFRLYYRYARKKATSRFTLRKAIMSALQDDLSHVEIHWDNGLKVVQRDIFSGTIIEIVNDASGLDFASQEKLERFEPIGIRTVDLDALFNYDQELSFSFVPGGNYFIVKGKTTDLTGLLSWCLFDELGRIEVLGK